jgi:hypothetical protein
MAFEIPIRRVTVRIEEETTRREGETSQLKEGVEDPAFRHLAQPR